MKFIVPVSPWAVGTMATAGLGEGRIGEDGKGAKRRGCSSEHGRKEREQFFLV